MAFTKEEITYLRSQPLARLATVSADGQPDVVPVGFDFDGTYLYVSGHGDTINTRKFRNVLAGNARVALVVDDLVSTSPWTPGFLRLYGTADLVERDGYVGRGPYLRITPTISWSWNLAARPFEDETDETGPKLAVTRTIHQPPAQQATTKQPAASRR